MARQTEYELQMRVLLGMRYTHNQAVWGKEGNTMVVHRAKGSYKLRTDRPLELRELLLLVVRKEDNSVGEYLGILLREGNVAERTPRVDRLLRLGSEMCRGPEPHVAGRLGREAAGGHGRVAGDGRRRDRDLRGAEG